MLRVRPLVLQPAPQGRAVAGSVSDLSTEKERKVMEPIKITSNERRALAEIASRGQVLESAISTYFRALVDALVKADLVERDSWGNGGDRLLVSKVEAGSLFLCEDGKLWEAVNLNGPIGFKIANHRLQKAGPDTSAMPEDMGEATKKEAESRFAPESEARVRTLVEMLE